MTYRRVRYEENLKQKEELEFSMKPRHRVFCPIGRRPKLLFVSEEKANRYMQFNNGVIEEENGYAPVRSYYCRVCGGWHLTSKPATTFPLQLEAVKLEDSPWDKEKNEADNLIEMTSHVENAIKERDYSKARKVFSYLVVMMQASNIMLTPVLKDLLERISVTIHNGLIGI